LLIDTTHRRWAVGTVLTAILAVALYLGLARATPGGLTGGSVVGLWYGIAGSLLMAYAGLLAAHRKLLKWPFVPGRSWWLKGHIWLGSLSVVFIFCHSGGRFGGTFETVLMIVFLLTLLTGVLGLWLQQVLPRLLTSRGPAEVPYQQVPHVCRALAARAEETVRLVLDARPLDGTGAGLPPLDPATRDQVETFYQENVQPYLGEHGNRTLALAQPFQAEGLFAHMQALPGLAAYRAHLDRLAVYCRERRQLYEQDRLYHWLHAWLLVHVPLSAALLVLGVAHAVMALYY
jgi:hypothetical protein